MGKFNKKLAFFNDIVSKKKQQINEQNLNKITTPFETRPTGQSENVLIVKPTFKELNMLVKKEDLVKERNVLNKNIRTADIAREGEKTVSTSQMGDEIVNEIKSLL